MTASLLFPPAFILILGALLVPLIPGKAKNIYVIALPALAFWMISQLPHGELLSVHFFGHDLSLLRVDKLSKIFGYVFTLNATIVCIYAFYLKDSQQHMSALGYIGGALGVVFSGDLITLYFFWEWMAVCSTFLILARRTPKAYGAGYRYVMLHLFGGLVLLAGIVLHINGTGSIGFDAFTDRTLASYLILAGILVNAAAPPFHAWLSDAYPEATVTGGLILSAYTTKTSVYTLIRGYAGYEILIVVGCVMALYGIIYALLENDMRRILAYSIINQVGFMICGIGIGTAMSLNGAAAHAFCHIIYKSLLWMSAGSVLYMTGKSKCTELGGLYKTMPWTMIFGTIGALAISSVPFTSGYTSKPLIIEAAVNQHLVWPWLILEIASAGVFLHAGIKFPYFVFFNQDRGLRPGEPPHKTMLWAMGIMAFLCIFLGCYPAPLYALLPFEMEPHVPYTLSGVIKQFQLLMLSALAFFVFLKLLKRTDTIAIDTDIIWRKGGRWFYICMDKGLNFVNYAFNELMHKGAATGLGRYFSEGPLNMTLAVLPADEAKREQITRYFRAGISPIGLSVAVAALYLFGFIILTLP
ncbi:Na(+)/H(+) antiporter subunit D [Desulfovibrio ferrophilus]|uniref:NADH/ubiquinone/plastoquinone n=1 Tax=Desulfovibrio ferrophilus TaxID=241368 RepID=A0A2Z6AXP3_9BACT|nr:Na(+)/H(+) antiporter subunit D [Desulfovibrio ferrophilus]BBD08024.1 NADH/ubiquinone/plastoquinone [Desulfovibrio ferrophilus]